MFSFFFFVTIRPPPRSTRTATLSPDPPLFLSRIVDYKTGRLYPSIGYLMRQLRRSRAAIVHALARLKEHGFLEWIRRTEPTGNVGFGPQVRQITNAYRFCLPPAARRMVERIVGKGPAPDDDTHRREAAAQEMEAMLASLPADQRMHAMIERSEEQTSELQSLMRISYA